MFTIVGFESVECKADIGDSLPVGVNLKSDEYVWLTLKEAHELQTALSHVIAVVSAEEIKGS